MKIQYRKAPLETQQRADDAPATVGRIREDGVLEVEGVLFSSAPVVEPVDGRMVEFSVKFNERTVRAMNKRGATRPILRNHGERGDMSDLFTNSSAHIDHQIGSLTNMRFETRGRGSSAVDVIAATWLFDPSLAVDASGRDLIGPIHRGIMSQTSAGYSFDRQSLKETSAGTDKSLPQMTAKLAGIREGSLVGLQADPVSGLNRSANQVPPEPVQTDATRQADIDAAVDVRMAEKAAVDAQRKAEEQATADAESLRKMQLDAAGSYGAEKTRQLLGHSDNTPKGFALQIAMHEADIARAAPASDPPKVPTTPGGTRAEGGEPGFREAFDDMKVVALARGLPVDWGTVWRAECQKRGLDVNSSIFGFIAQAATSAGMDAVRAYESAASREGLVADIRGMKRGAAAGSLVTSDLEFALQEIVRVSLEAGYERTAIPADRLGREVALDDFRKQSFVQYDIAADWKTIATSAELVQFRQFDDEYFLQADQYGGLARIDDTAIVNDQLGVFVGLPATLGEYVGGEESRIAIETTQAGFNGAWDVDHNFPEADATDFDTFLDKIRLKALSLHVVADSKAILKPNERRSHTAALVPTFIMFGPAIRKKWIEYSEPVSAAQGAGLDARSEVVRGEYERTLRVNGFEALQLGTVTKNSFYGPRGTQEARLWGRVRGRERRVDIFEAPPDRKPGWNIRYLSTFGYKIAKNTMFRVEQT